MKEGGGEGEGEGGGNATRERQGKKSEGGNGSEEEGMAKGEKMFGVSAGVKRREASSSQGSSSNQHMIFHAPSES